MNKIILSIVFILLGIFIYYILKEQCKCDIVEGQLSRLTALNVVLESAHTAAEREAILRHPTSALDGGGALAAELIRNPCSPLNFIPLVKDVVFVTECFEELAKSALNAEMGECHPDQIKRDGEWIENPYMCHFRHHQDEGGQNVHPQFVAFGLKQVINHLNDSLIKNYDHSDGICVKNGNANLNENERKECLNVISSLSSNPAKISELNATCSSYDTCKKMFINTNNCTDLDQDSARLAGCRVPPPPLPSATLPSHHTRAETEAEARIDDRKLSRRYREEQLNRLCENKNASLSNLIHDGDISYDCESAFELLDDYLPEGGEPCDFSLSDWGDYRTLSYYCPLQCLPECQGRSTNQDTLPSTNDSPPPISMGDWGNDG